ncbi:MAG TPA: methionyl-tRNA formyltransferase [Betaproteobacteria bacterium]|jgi:methionyl-tRNA formyltransferase|nr:methionyl-tRNA formyltransferase [Betaproteobacteria bacterium]
MNIIFAGTPAFSAVSLKALIANGHKIPLVITQPDRRAGRGMSMMPSEVKKTAIGLGIETYQPANLKSPGVLDRIRQEPADLMIVVAFGQIVPKEILTTFPFGCINVHASLLPRWRGAAPIQRAIMAGDKETGVCIMQMEEGLDTGPVFCERRIPIVANDTAKSLHDILADLGAEALIHTLSDLDSRIPVVQQAGSQVTYAHKINNDDALIDWAASSSEIDRLVRAMDSEPGAHTFLGESRIKIWETKVLDQGDSQSGPGTVIELAEDGFVVACKKGTLKVRVIQRPGGKKSSAAEYVRAFGLKVGHEFK